VDAGGYDMRVGHKTVGCKGVQVNSPVTEWPDTMLRIVSLLTILSHFLTNSWGHLHIFLTRYVTL